MNRILPRLPPVAVSRDVGERDFEVAGGEIHGKARIAVQKFPTFRLASYHRPKPCGRPPRTGSDSVASPIDHSKAEGLSGTLASSYPVR